MVQDVADNQKQKPVTRSCNIRAEAVIDIRQPQGHQNGPKIANLSEASRVSSLQGLARMTTPIARDIRTPRPLLLVAGSGHSSNLEALHNLHTTCLRKGDCVRVVLSTQHHLIRTD